MKTEFSRDHNFLHALIHLANSAWIVQIALAFLRDQTRTNLLTDPLLLGTLLATACLHILRWLVISKETIALGDDLGSLSRALTNTTAGHLGKTPYLIAPKLNSSLTLQRAIALREHLASTSTTTAGNLFFLTFNFPKAKLVFLATIGLALFALSQGPALPLVPEFARHVVVVFFVLSAIVGLAIYSAAILIYTTFIHQEE
ncbi:hypothetical protein [Caldimonas sp.]|uniref:hypothetical protein n=1 Tax=Caldimonas sp. TaxID=2838790 RepID=UPI00391B8150